MLHDPPSGVTDALGHAGAWGLVARRIRGSLKFQVAALPTDRDGAVQMPARKLGRAPRQS